MKIIVAIVLCFFGAICFAQKQTKDITNIRASVEAINKDSNYTIKSIDAAFFLENMPDNGGSITGYFKEGQLMKIDVYIGLSSCITTTTFYLEDTKLIFAYTQAKNYHYDDDKGAFDYAKQTLTMESRYYYANGEILKTIVTGASMCSEGTDLERANENLAHVSTYIHLLKNK